MVSSKVKCKVKSTEAGGIEDISCSNNEGRVVHGQTLTSDAKTVVKEAEGLDTSTVVEITPSGRYENLSMGKADGEITVKNMSKIGDMF